MFLGLAALLAVTGCAAAPASTPGPNPAPAAAATAPAGGVLLTDLGFTHAPAGFSLPRTVVIDEAINAGNNVTVVLTQPSGAEVADYLRRHLDAMGFTITADGGGSLLFESATHDGAFTVTDGLAALSLRTDRAE
ncbi:hypothetical protein TLA_TLA_00798 [Tessaracoccus lapidicaptus]|nr:hypothetical protein TLA_TLA_00798 [Tessaracoccus lapidicaptus]